MKSFRGGRAAVLAVTFVGVGACASADQNPDATPPDAACVPAAELCNAADDDCDDQIDEGFDELGATCTVGSGSCEQTGTRVCSSDGSAVRCDAVAGTGGAETCNGIDDDCDDTTDEGFGLGDPCDGGDDDLCTEGTMMCDAAGAPVCGDATGDAIEVCNGDDDDCDTVMDEGLGLGAGCDGSDGDLCTEGTVVCSGSGGTTCSDVTGTTPETCNGVDDDCAGGIDTGFGVGGACSTGVGACNRPGQHVCNGGGNGVVCDAVAASPTPESCGDGTDQDCNGSDVSCPINDRPTGAVNVSAGGTFTVDLVAASDDRRNSCSSTTTAGGRDVFYTFTLPAAEVVYLDTLGSSFDTTIAVLPGACPSATTEVGCGDDACSGLQSQLALSLAAGTYCVVIDQFSSAQTTGALVLNVHRAGRTGIAIAASSGSQTGDTCGGSNQSSPACQTTSDQRDVGYFFPSCPSITRTVGASTCTGTTWDSVVYMRSSPGVTVAGTTCNDDGCGATTPFRQSTFSGATAAGAGLTWLIVDGFGSTATAAQCGPYTLSYTIN